jgi:hypothetical protein
MVPAGQTEAKLSLIVQVRPVVDIAVFKSEEMTAMVLPFNVEPVISPVTAKSVFTK